MNQTKFFCFIILDFLVSSILIIVHLLSILVFIGSSDVFSFYKLPA